MKISVIISFNVFKQSYFEMEVTSEQINDPEKLFSAITQSMLKKRVKDIYKISCCAYANKEDLPAWFIEENGKLWCENGKIIK